MEWEPIETAPKDADILVWFDSDSDPYQDPDNPEKLTAFGAWSEGGSFMDGKGICVAKWQSAEWVSENSYGDGYWMPGWWFAKQNGDYELPVAPTHWMQLPEQPK